MKWMMALKEMVCFLVLEYCWLGDRQYLIFNVGNYKYTQVLELTSHLSQDRSPCSVPSCNAGTAVTNRKQASVKCPPIVNVNHDENLLVCSEHI